MTPSKRRSTRPPRKRWGPINRSDNAARPWSGAYVARPNGRSFYDALCPFCGLRQDVSAWSVRGGGKRCEGCGAMFNGWGTCRPVEGRETPE